MSSRNVVSVLAGLLFVTACGGPLSEAPPDVSAADEELSSRDGPQLVQLGEGLRLFGVTNDFYAVYADAQTLFATRLRPGAERHRIVEIPAGVNPTLQISGEVVFVWSDPTTGVSPLWIWSRRTGSLQASTASVPSSFAAAASEEGRELLFTSNVSADGSTGDVVFARTDLSNTNVILRNVPLGACPASLGFARAQSWRRSEFPVAGYCEPGQSTASLAVFPYGRRRVLASNLFSPITLTANPGGTRFFTRDAQRNALIVSPTEPVQRVDTLPVGLGFWSDERTVHYPARLPTGTFELHRATAGRPDVTVSTTQFASFASFFFGMRDSAVAPDGSALPYVTNFNPATGISDQWLMPTRRASQAIRVEAQQQTLLCGLGFPGTGANLKPFTNNSRHFFYSANVDGSTGLAVMGTRDERGVRTFSNAQGYICAAAGPSSVVFNDSVNTAQGTGDLKVVDLSPDTLAPTLVWPQADVNFFVVPFSRRVAFTVSTGDGRHGLYAVQTRRHSHEAHGD